MYHLSLIGQAQRLPRRLNGYFFHVIPVKDWRSDCIGLRRYMHQMHRGVVDGVYRKSYTCIVSGCIPSLEGIQECTWQGVYMMVATTTPRRDSQHLLHRVQTNKQRPLYGGIIT